MAEMVARWKLVATGKVQLVGYRERVATEAETRGLVGAVENDERDERRVLITVQGPVGSLEEFRRTIESPEGRTLPKSVTREETLPPDAELTEFRVKRGEVHLEILERMEQGNRILGSMDRRLGSLEDIGKETLEVSRETLTVSSETLGVSRETLAVSRETLAVSRATLAVSRATLAETKKVGKEVRESNLRLKRSLERMHGKVTRRFDRVDDSYRTIERRQLRVGRNLEKLTRSLRLAQEPHRPSVGTRAASAR